jgi:class 3 adenylate cyclase/tetratricopeptide (TPR) repeat protein
LQSIRQWLAGLGLEQYAAAFERDDVDINVLPELSEADLQQLGVSLGHRKRILAALRDANGALDRRTLERSPAPPVESLTAEGERRQVSVLFCDLVGSTALSNRLDPEDYRRVLARYHETGIGCVQRFEGFVAQIQGDGIVAYFGYPLAHEGEAERAIRAALAIVQALSALDVGLGAPLAVRIGVASGLVVVSHVLAPDKSAVGETPNLAQRLQTLAQPGEVMVSERTRALARGAFDYAERGLHTLKGIAEPTRVWQVLGPSGAASRFEAATADALTPMVGREQEIALLVDRWERARAGEGQVVLLQGEPGIGKSRMLRAFRERLGDRIELALQYQCSPYYVNSAFYPIIDHLERALRFERDDSAEARLDKIERRVTGELGRTATECQLLACVMTLPAETRYRPLEMTPQRRKEETVALLVDIVAQIACQQAAVVLFEDVHWADPSTIEVLTALVARAERLPLLVLITYRPEFQPPWIAHSHVTPIGLTRLSRAQGANIALRVAGGKPLPSDLTVQIVDKTDGVPLFIEELTRAVLESGIVVDTGERYDCRGESGKLTIPATLRDSLMARLDRLLPAKEVAQIGACLGREFDHELLRAVSPMSEAQLDVALGELTASELVFRRGIPPRASYLFKHALVQDAAYDSLLKSKRQALHAQIAEAIRERFPAKARSEPELLAHHYTEAGITDQAILYWQRAGELAQQRFALQEAVGSYRRAVQLLGTAPATQPNMLRHIDIAVNWADLIVPSQEVVAALETAERYAEELADTPRLATVTSYLGQLLFYLGRTEPAATRLRRVIGMPDGVASKDRIGSAYRCLGQLNLFAYSRCADALRYIERAVPIVQAAGNRFEESCCYGLLGLEYGFLGRYQQSFAAFDHALGVARAAREHSIECWNLKWRSHIHCLKGEWDEAAAITAQGIALAEKIGNVWARDWCTVVRCYASYRTSEDPALVQQARSALQGLAGTICVSNACCYLADLLLFSGDLEGATVTADRALAELDYGSYFSSELRAYLIKGVAASLQPSDHTGSAAHYLEMAANLALSQQRAPHLAICRVRQAQLEAQQGAHAGAISYLGQAEDAFVALDMPWWLNEARKLHAALRPA